MSEAILPPPLKLVEAPSLRSAEGSISAVLCSVSKIHFILTEAFPLIFENSFLLFCVAADEFT